MNKKILNKVTSLGITLALSSSLGLAACAKRENNYIPMNEIFYDENTYGIDDAFEDRVLDSNDQIRKLKKLERCVELLKKLNEINYDDNLDVDNISITQGDIDFINLDEIEKMYDEYQKKKRRKTFESDYHEREYKYNLYVSYITLNTYIDNNGYNILYNFGKKLYKAIILDTANYTGDETHAKAYINNYIGNSDGFANNAVYTSDDGSKEVLNIDSNSKLYSLINLVSGFEKYNNLKELKVSSTYDKEEIETIEEALKFYKECIYTEYEVKDHKFLFFDGQDELLSKDTNVPTK